MLRESEYLSTTNFSENPKNIYGEELYPDMRNLTSNAKDKRLEFWDAVKKGENIVKVKYDLLQVIHGRELEDLLFVHETED